jgi:hypothetical protein
MIQHTRHKDARALVCFRIPSISRRYDRVSTLPRSLTNAFSPQVHVSCPPVYRMFIVRGVVLVTTYSHSKNKKPQGS